MVTAQEPASSVGPGVEAQCGRLVVHLLQFVEEEVGEQEEEKDGGGHEQHEARQGHPTPQERGVAQEQPLLVRRAATQATRTHRPPGDVL